MKKVGIVGAHFYKFINMGQIQKSQSIQVQSPIKYIFFKCGFGVDSWGEAWGTNKMSIEIAYIAHAHVCEFLESK